MAKENKTEIDKIEGAIEKFPECSIDAAIYFIDYGDTILSCLTHCKTELEGQGEWQPITEPLKGGNWLVTNNIDARLKGGDMSHVWLVRMVHETSEVYGRFTAFHGDNDARLWGLTHYRPLDTRPTLAKKLGDE